MSDKPDLILLNEQEAVEVLQPHMHNKSALHWLQNDRLYNPAIPFHMLQGQPYYLEQDLFAFVTRMLNPRARVVRTGNHLYMEKRSTSDRRRYLDRRMNAEIVLSPGVERRRPNRLDRRTDGQMERRSQHAA